MVSRERLTIVASTELWPYPSLRPFFFLFIHPSRPAAGVRHSRSSAAAAAAEAAAKYRFECVSVCVVRTRKPLHAACTHCRRFRKPSAISAPAADPRLEKKK